MKEIVSGFIALLLMLPLAYADSGRVTQISNGGYFSLEKDENAILQFKDFSDREITLTSIEKNAVRLQNPENITRPFFKENEQPGVNKGAVHLAFGEEVRSHETIEMLCIIRLERTEDDKAVFKITYYSVPPAPKISLWQKITIQIVK